MSTLKEEMFHATTQKEKEQEKKRRSQPMQSEFQASSEAKMQNADCTCHTGRCGCQEK